MRKRERDRDRGGRNRVREKERVGEGEREGDKEKVCVWEGDIGISLDHLFLPFYYNYLTIYLSDSVTTLQMTYTLLIKTLFEMLDLIHNMTRGP